MLKTLSNVQLLTYRGVKVNFLTDIDWKDCVIFIFEFLDASQSWIL